MQTILRTWLFQQCELLSGAVRGVLLTGPLDKGPFSDAVCWPEEQADGAMLNRVAHAALDSRQAVIKARHAESSETSEPLDALACPVLLGEQLYGVVAVEISHRSLPLKQAAIQQLQSGVKWLEVMIRLHGTMAQLANLVDLVTAGLDGEEFRVAASEVANELMERFSCHRVSLGFIQRNQMRVEVVSHSSRVEQKSNIVKALRDAMSEAADQGAVLTCPAVEGAELAITQMHERLALMLPGTSICTVPMIKQGKAVGALLLERSKENPFTPEVIEQCQQIGLLLGPLLELRRRDEMPLPGKILSSVRSGLGKLFGPRHVSLKVVSAFCLMLLLFCSLTHGTFHVSADSVIEADVRRAIVAPMQGYIATAHARAGDLVRAGDPLVELDDRDLLLQQLKWQSQRAQLLKEYRKALSGADRAEIAILKAKRAQVEAQLNLVEQQLARASLAAPFDGLVVKGDLSQSLGSPVERGEILFEVAPTDEYRVILKVDDRDIGWLKKGQQAQLKLSGLPEKKIGLRIDQITPVSVSEKGHNYFRVEALPDSHSELLRPGMEGIAKVTIGEETLIWIWTRQLVDWLRLFVWQRLP
ncbi:MAG: HlyD family efflux transporter periplasmic adaptor subunit [Desulfuromonadales bacterium]|nr:HlyD family efflux transporter periplasmic adaptor subunit [Desulfuromonadales bacterium]